MSILIIKNKRIMLVISIIFIVLLLIVFLVKYNNYNFLFDNKYVYRFDANYDEMQKKIDEELINYINDKNISIDLPKVVLNPYGNSPLTALIIFYTEKKIKIQLYVNDVFMTTMDSSNSHVIPVYGLRENYNNKIKLVDEEGKEKKLNIRTNILKKNELSSVYSYYTKNISNNYLFINSSNGKYVIDNEGYVSWYSNIGNCEVDIDSDKFIYLIDKYHRIIETDFLGRIYRVYNVDIGYADHQIKKLNNNNFMVINDIYFISEIDYKTGKIINSINVLDELKKIDENFEVSVDSLYINFFQYNEDNDTLLISVRGLDAIINYDLVNRKIIWVFSDNDIFSSKFENYKLKLIGNSNYFVGQHTPYLDGNLLYVFNNNNFLLSTFNLESINNSSVIVYEINQNLVKEVYRYQSSYSSAWYGSFYEQDEIKNINFGCVLANDNELYSKIIELDKNDNIITEFDSKYKNIPVYQSFRESFYNEETSNYQINTDLYEINDEATQFLYYETDEIKLYKGSNDLKKKLKNSIYDNTLIDFTPYGIITDILDSFEIFFVDSNFNYYKKKLILDGSYSDNNCMYLNMFVSRIKGKYAVYIKINDKYYNPNLVFNIV